MTIRTRMTLLFLGIISFLLTILCFAIYFEGELHRQKEYKTRLRQEALTATTIFFNKEEISPDLLKLLDKNNFTALIQEEIAIYDSTNQIIYESGSDKLNVKPLYLKQIRQEKELFWEENDLEMYGTVIKNDNQSYIVLATAEIGRAHV